MGNSTYVLGVQRRQRLILRKAERASQKAPDEPEPVVQGDETDEDEEEDVANQEADPDGGEIEGRANVKSYANVVASPITETNTESPIPALDQRVDLGEEDDDEYITGAPGEVDLAMFDEVVEGEEELLKTKEVDMEVEETPEERETLENVSEAQGANKV